MGWKNKLVLFLIIILFVISFGNYQTAYNYYLSGIKAYRAGSYKMSETLLEKALSISSKIEQDIPEIKLYIGIDAFHNEEYEKAKIYLSQFPDNALALEILKNIKENNLTEKLNFDSFKLDKSQPTPQSTDTKKEKFNFVSFIMITLIVFLLSALSGFLVFFVIKKFGFMNSTVEVLSNNENEDNNFQNIKNISIEEVINLKLDNVENIWNKSKALKKLLNEVEGNPQQNLENDEDIENMDKNISQNLEETTNTKELSSKIDESLKDANIDELENLLDELEGNIENKEEVPEIDNSTDLLSENVEEDDDEEREKFLKEKQEVEEKLKTVETAIEPDKTMKKNYESFLKEETSEFEKEAYLANGFNSIVEDIEKDNTNNGSKVYSKIQLEKMFKTLFFELNNEENIL
ncbi:hypothetical protein OSSY52_20850 [Tepiditoga spiralis]|uniref:Uncharacterized protein n=1 Tax=Tepiditoga spiralis TaxID=2108365 RepID=A0A7G1G9M6_9BACT|nr:hypothetical protein [Tepiditoga spiralis]BBE31944.1 hypothetical protein OSSY52_20850 [Tepiditoga spiralis]